MGCKECGYETGNHSGSFCSVDDREEIPHLRARIAALEAQLAQYRWRRVEDEMPEAQAYVLTFDCGYLTESYVDDEGVWWSKEFDAPIHGVKHWMPLPPAPEEGE